MKILVRLTPDEVRRAAYGGVDRRISAMLDGRRGRRHENIPFERQQWWQTTIIGALGELAVAKALGHDWDPTIGRIDSADVGRYQVRATEAEDPKLRVRLHDKLTDTFILAQVRGHRVTLHGWAPGQYVRDHGREEFPNVWSIPAGHLFALQDLNTEIGWCDFVTPVG